MRKQRVSDGSEGHKMPDRLKEIRARLDAYRKDGHYAVVCDHFTAEDIAWLLDEVERLGGEANG